MPQPSSRRRRIPAFAPVPTRPRKGGWCAVKQAEFIAHLSATRCVALAARRCGMTRESAYRLRCRAGAESFAAAWDAIMDNFGQLTPRKVTPQELWHRVHTGLIQPTCHGGIPGPNLWKQDNSALLRLARRYRHAAQRLRSRHRKGAAKDG